MSMFDIPREQRVNRIVKNHKDVPLYAFKWEIDHIHENKEFWGDKYSEYLLCYLIAKSILFGAKL